MTIKQSFVSLLSGGLDSPVACALMVKLGFIPIFLTFSTSRKNSLIFKRKITAIIKKICINYEKSTQLYYVEFDQFLGYVSSVCQRKLTCLMCKRTMIRIAKEIGKIENTRYIVTGDILGEQASQTLDNLFSYNSLIDDFVLIRPLIGFNKDEVVKLNKNFGLYQLCSQKIGECRFNPQYPETHARMDEIRIASSIIRDYNLKALLNEAEIIRV